MQGMGLPFPRADLRAIAANFFPPLQDEIASISRDYENVKAVAEAMVERDPNVLCCIKRAGGVKGATPDASRIPIWQLKQVRLVPMKMSEDDAIERAKVRELRRSFTLMRRSRRRPRRCCWPGSIALTAAELAEHQPTPHERRRSDQGARAPRQGRQEQSMSEQWRVARRLRHRPGRGTRFVHDPRGRRFLGDRQSPPSLRPMTARSSIKAETRLIRSRCDRSSPVEDVTLAVVLVVSVLASLAGCGRCSHRGCFERRDRPGCCSSIGVSASCRWYQRFDNRSRLPANAIRSLETTYGGARTDTLGPGPFTRR